ncbi:hypothetical protein [Mycobacterium sp. SM1]|uniref:hypothetical protein n=1 Tax=Mycobacterium sp. SM1 TaxID=2816243 RepID=UPI001F1BBE1F|nr:hypothetical protein [Mycobacterium sp. SM1]
MFARVLGPFLVIVCAIAIARASETRALLSDFAGTALWSWAAGSFVLVAGLIIIALHQHWRNPAAVIVSLLGWLLALRGLLLLAFPAVFLSMANSVINAGALWKTINVFLGVIGLYLSYVGWRPAPVQPKPQETSPTRDLPRAA